jgi:3-oxoacyl-[acyl-carrier-protein] synthase-1/3-oxoacyl-[acyl-carrier-protein] synthase II
MDFLFRGERFPSPPTVFPDADPDGPPVFRIEADFWRPERFRERSDTRTARLTLTAAAEALADAGVDREALRSRRVGVCLGTNSAGAVSNAALAECAPVPDGEYRTPAQRYAAGSPALALAREYGLAGPVETVVTACSAGTDAIGLAAAWIRMGLCDLVITGGADELYEITYTGFASLMNTDPGPCKPFDADRNGLTLGEGAGVIILESAESLRERGKSARGAIRGYGNAGDAFHLTSPEPDGRGLRLAISEAMSGAGLSDLSNSANPAEPDGPGALAFINAHGTGTRDNDRIESLLFADLFPGTPFLSTKGFTGHTLGAAGAVEAIFSIGCLERGAVPPNAGFRTPDPELPNAPVAGVTEIRGTTALSQTLAFGGNNAVLVVSAGAEVPR